MDKFNLLDGSAEAKTRTLRWSIGILVTLFGIFIMVLLR